MISSFFPFVVDRKQTQSIKPLLYYLVLNRNNCVVKTLYIVFIIVREMTKL